MTDWEFTEEELAELGVTSLEVDRFKQMRSFMGMGPFNRAIRIRYGDGDVTVFGANDNLTHEHERKIIEEWVGRAKTT